MEGLKRSLVLLALLLGVGAGPAEAEEPVPAVWKERELRFSYRGFATVYPCALLQQRIAVVLNAVGARPDLEVSVFDCGAPLASTTIPLPDAASRPRSPVESGAGYPPGLGVDPGWPRGSSGNGRIRQTEPRQEAEVRVRLAVPTEMTPEVNAELEADRRRRELIAQVTGNPRPLFEDPIPFAAHRQVITLSRATIGLEPADCELLDQMASGVLRELGVRVVRRGYTCDRGWRSRIPPTLEVETLVPVGFSLEPARALAPGSGESDAPEPEQAEASAPPADPGDRTD